MLVRIGDLNRVFRREFEKGGEVYRRVEWRFVFWFGCGFRGFMV